MTPDRPLRCSEEGREGSRGHHQHLRRAQVPEIQSLHPDAEVYVIARVPV